MPEESCEDQGLLLCFLVLFRNKRTYRAQRWRGTKNNDPNLLTRNDISRPTSTSIIYSRTYVFYLPWVPHHMVVIGLEHTLHLRAGGPILIGCHLWTVTLRCAIYKTVHPFSGWLLWVALCVTTVVDSVVPVPTETFPLLYSGSLDLTPCDVRSILVNESQRTLDHFGDWSHKVGESKPISRTCFFSSQNKSQPLLLVEGI